MAQLITGSRDMKNLNPIPIFLCLISISGCATIFSDKTDQLTIHSNDPSAKIIVNGNQVGTGSAVYSLARDKTAIITASKKGCSDMSVPTTQSLNGVTFINLIFWPGYLIDAASGSIHKADPTDYAVTPNCDN
jgi:hypothetical protein